MANTYIRDDDPAIPDMSKVDGLTQEEWDAKADQDETATLLAEIKEELARKDETYALIADSRPTKDCFCGSCVETRIRNCTDCGGTGEVLNIFSSCGGGNVYSGCRSCNPDPIVTGKARIRI